MPKDFYSRESAVRAASVAHTGGTTEVHCAYNQTRRRFLSAKIEAADFSIELLKDRIPALRSESGRALWITPFREIAPTFVSVPIDLLSLDKNCLVTETVESFPINQLSSSKRPAASVLALPAGTIASTGTRVGDRLSLGTSSEIQQLLQLSEEAVVEVPPIELRQAAPRSAMSGAEQTTRPTGKLLKWVEDATPKLDSPIDQDPIERADQPEALPASSPSTSATEAPSADQEPPKSKGWLQRLFSAEPPDARKAPREALTWVAAYFFTGGAPAAHFIRNISATGMYLLTQERWSPGTILRITLCDSRKPSGDLCITVNAEVVRLGNDGIGLRFMLADKGRTGQSKMALGDSAIALTRAHIERFLHAAKR